MVICARIETDSDYNLMKYNKGACDMNKEQGNSVEQYYNSVSDLYHEQYEREQIFNTEKEYPANYFRMQLMLNSFINKKIKRVIEVGVGEGTPLSNLARAGIEPWGFDISTEMVDKSKRKMKENNLNDNNIFWGDIQDPTTYVHALKDGQFDGLMAMGVMPHVENDEMVLKNMSSLVKPGGSVFVEFRNSLFSLFSMNRYTADFILNDLLQNVGAEVKSIVKKDIEKRLNMDSPLKREYDFIPSKFHNPFEVLDLFKKLNFINTNLHWYHYHPAMPYLEEATPKCFREEAIKLEHETSSWRGMFLCSAFVVEADKKED